jgi:hypothetical protein
VVPELAPDPAMQPAYGGELPQSGNSRRLLASFRNDDR